MQAVTVYDDRMHHPYTVYHPPTKIHCTPVGVILSRNRKKKCSCHREYAVHHPLLRIFLWDPIGYPPPVVLHLLVPSLVTPEAENTHTHTTASVEEGHGLRQALRTPRHRLPKPITSLLGGIRNNRNNDSNDDGKNNNTTIIVVFT